mgnify:CR=1 FL=1
MQRRIIGGREIAQEEYSGRYYKNALKARKYLKEKLEDLFRQVDVIIMPTVPKLPHKIGTKISVKDMYAYDVLTVPASITGIPAISIPAGKINNIPVGLQIMASYFKEDLIFDIAGKFKEDL